MTSWSESRCLSETSVDMLDFTRSVSRSRPVPRSPLLSVVPNIDALLWFKRPLAIWPIIFCDWSTSLSRAVRWKINGHRKIISIALRQGNAHDILKDREKSSQNAQRSVFCTSVKHNWECFTEFVMCTVRTQSIERVIKAWDATRWPMDQISWDCTLPARPMTSKVIRLSQDNASMVVVPFALDISDSQQSRS